MKVRALHAQDIPILSAIYENSGFGYGFPDLEGPMMESVLVVVDDDDRIIAAAAAERITQLYLLPSADYSPAVKIAALHLLHEAMATELRELGYTDSNAFLPPSLPPSFARRLMKTFGWRENWKSLFRRF